MTTGDYLSVLSHGLIVTGGTGDYVSVLSHGLLVTVDVPAPEPTPTPGLPGGASGGGGDTSDPRWYRYGKDARKSYAEWLKEQEAKRKEPAPHYFARGDASVSVGVSGKAASKPPISTVKGEVVALTSGRGWCSSTVPVFSASGSGKVEVTLDTRIIQGADFARIYQRQEQDVLDAQIDEEDRMLLGI